MPIISWERQDQNYLEELQLFRENISVGILKRITLE